MIDTSVIKKDSNLTFWGSEGAAKDAHLEMRPVPVDFFPLLLQDLLSRSYASGKAKKSKIVN